MQPRSCQSLRPRARRGDEGRPRTTLRHATLLPAMSTAAVLLATGFEEIEAITVIDVLRRAEIATTVVGVGTGPGARAITGAHGITVQADRAIDELGDEIFD